MAFAGKNKSHKNVHLYGSQDDFDILVEDEGYHTNTPGICYSYITQDENDILVITQSEAKRG